MTHSCRRMRGVGFGIVAIRVRRQSAFWSRSSSVRAFVQYISRHGFAPSASVQDRRCRRGCSRLALCLADFPFGIWYDLRLAREIERELSVLIVRQLSYSPHTSPLCAGRRYRFRCGKFPRRRLPTTLRAHQVPVIDRAEVPTKSSRTPPKALSECSDEAQGRSASVRT